jgi:anaerobic magnesium-protoporphyrin IX monomethyl ester cyclase
MRILLIRPPVRTPLTITPPLGIGFVAASLKRDGHEVRVFDGVRRGGGLPAVVAAVDSVSADVVGLSLMTTDVPAAGELVRRIRVRFPRTVVIIGGPHVSALPEHSLSTLGATYGIAGEAEEGMPSLMRALEAGDGGDRSAIAGLVRRLDERTIAVNPPSILEDLDSLGPPAWDVLEPEAYPHAPLAGFARRFPTAPLLLTRGCPWRCRFCSAHAVHHRRVRRRSVEGILEEIDLLRARHGIKEFHFIDDNFAQDKPSTLALCRALSEVRPKVLWCVPQGIRLDSIDEEVAEAMVEAGCYRVLAGLESGSPRVLERMAKGVSLEEAVGKLWVLKKAGLRVGANFIVGYPGERPEDVERSISWSRTLPLDYCSFTAFVPYPGSEVFDELLGQGKISLEDLPKADMYVVERSYSDYLADKDIRRYRLKAYLGFFLRPGPILHFLTEVRSAGHLKMILRRIRVHLSHLGS